MTSLQKTFYNYDVVRQFILFLGLLGMGMGVFSSPPSWFGRSSISVSRGPAFVFGMLMAWNTG